jgi:lysozyme family protein
MFDVNQITSTLRGMGDKALQQYAAMNKGDPYILSLAVSESNQRKQLRAAAQGQAAGQQMPKVVDQDIAQMAPQQLPENQGIAQIPAPNMQHMADGGIAGFDESTNAPITTQRLDNMGKTNGMFNYAQDGGGVMRMAGGGMTGYMPGFNKTGSVNAAFEAALQKTLGYEGGYVEDDAGKGPSNFGINKAANPDVDIKGLTKEKARELYKKRYWDAIGGDALAAKNPALATVAFDTAVNMGVGKANQLVAKAKDDPSTLLGLRQQHYNNLVKDNPEKFAPYAKGWKERVADLATSVIPSAEAGTLPQQTQPAPEYQGQKATDTGEGAGAGITSLAGASGAALGAVDKMRQLYNTHTPLTRTGSMLRNLRPTSQLGIAAEGAGTAAAVPGIVGLGGGVLTAGAANALSNATPEQLEQLQGDIGSDTGLAAAIMNPANRAPENAPKMSYGEQMTNVAKTLVGHPDIGKMREANRAKAEETNQIEKTTGINTAGEALDKFYDLGPAALPKPAEKDVVEAAKEATPAAERKGFNNDDLLTLGLSLLASKSPNFMTALGEAGLATVAGKKEREKIEREEAKLKGTEELQKAQARQYGAYADLLERGGKEKKLEFEAEKEINDHMQAWDKTNKIEKMQNPMARMQEEARIRQQIYASIGIKPIMGTQAAPAGAGDFKLVGVR